jgi:hypothetical protein
MRDKNIFFDLQNKVDEIKRQERLIDTLQRIKFSESDRHQSLLNEIKRNSVRDLHNPLQNLLSSFNDKNNHFKFIEDLRHAEKSINNSVLNNLQSFQNSTIQNAKRFVDEAFSPFSKNNLASKRILRDFNQLRENLLSPLHSKHSDLLRSFETTTRATTLSSIEALSKSFAENNLFSNENLLRHISNSLLSYDRFASNTFAKLNNNLDQSTAQALKGSLTLANEQVLRSTSLVQSQIENFKISHSDKSNLSFDIEFPKVNRYRVQKQELLRRDDIEEDEDYDSLIIKSPSAISFDLVVNCLKIVGVCNETSLTTKGNSIFTITNSVYAHSFKLLQTVPTNKENFAEIVDYLYFILIEGAGGKFLRFVDYGDGKHFGYFVNTEPEVEVIWKIKHLRNKWLRHDIEHGTESDIKKSYQLRKETLEWFGMQKVPQSKDEFVFLYNILMLKVEEFLKQLLDRVSKLSD